MAQVNSQGYIVIQKGKPQFTVESKPLKTSHMIIYNRDCDLNPSVELRKVFFPRHLEGRRVRFKVEFVED